MILEQLPSEELLFFIKKRSLQLISKRLFEKSAKKRGDKGIYWWELRACSYYDVFEKPKIVYPDIAQRPEFAFDDTDAFLVNTYI